jgi:hypothetical protein
MPELRLLDCRPRRTSTRWQGHTSIGVEHGSPFRRLQMEGEGEEERYRYCVYTSHGGGDVSGGAIVASEEAEGATWRHPRRLCCAVPSLCRRGCPMPPLHECKPCCHTARSNSAECTRSKLLVWHAHCRRVQPLAAAVQCGPSQYAALVGVFPQSASGKSGAFCLALVTRHVCPAVHVSRKVDTFRTYCVPRRRAYRRTALPLRQRCSNWTQPCRHSSSPSSVPNAAAIFQLGLSSVSQRTQLLSYVCENRRRAAFWETGVLSEYSSVLKA